MAGSLVFGTVRGGGDGRGGEDGEKERAMLSGVVMVPGWIRFKNRIFITFHKWMILNHIPIPEKMVNNNTYRGVMVQSRNRFQNAAMMIPRRRHDDSNSSSDSSKTRNHNSTNAE